MVGAALAVLAGCTAGEAEPRPSTGEPSLNTTGGSDGDADRSSGVRLIPHFLVINVEGDWHDVSEPPRQGEWTRVVENDNCEISSRGELIQEHIDDERAHSEDLLERLADSDGSQAGRWHEQNFVVEGGVDSAEPEQILEFLSGAWSAHGSEYFGAVRAINTMNYEGEDGAATLELLIACTGEELSPETIDMAVMSLRPRMPVATSQPGSFDEPG